MPLTPLEKLDAKVANEGSKLTANLCNTLAAGTVLGGVITPVVVDKHIDWAWAGFSLLGATASHFGGKLALTFLKPEE